jgi:hypothetical protein
MFRQTTNALLPTLLVIGLLTVGCSKGGLLGPLSKYTGSTDTGGNFEGLVAMKLDTQEGKEFDMTYFLKGSRSRIEFNVPNSPEGKGVMIWDPEAAKMTTLLPSKKMYMTMDLKDTGANSEEPASPKSSEESKFPKLTDTGKTETVAGYPCEHWLMGEQQEMDICVAKGFGYFGMGGQGAGSMKRLAFSPKLLAAAVAHPEWVKFLQGGAFPLKVTVMQDGKVATSMEATRIERKSLDDSLFAIPPDYKELNIQNPMAGRD